jgi:NAD(P)-dependent dehydrogenase (short-subunit alcohol dehydrogenase family)
LIWRGKVDWARLIFGLSHSASIQNIVKSIADLKEKDVEATFKTNIFAMIYLAKHAVPHLKKGSSIINTSSITTFKGSPGLLDYSATKGAIIGFTRSLAMQLAEKGIRVNAVAPGPVWTPLQPVSRSQENLDKWAEGGVSKIGRIGQPSEIATWVSLFSSAFYKSDLTRCFCSLEPTSSSPLRMPCSLKARRCTPMEAILPCDSFFVPLVRPIRDYLFDRAFNRRGHLS